MQVQVIAQRVFKIHSAVLAALIVTFLLFYFMQYLIATNNALGPQLQITRIINAIVPEFENIVIEVIEPPLPLQDLEPPESYMPDREFADGVAVMPSTLWTPPTTPVMNVTAIPLSSNIMIPLIRTMASYPSRTLANGIEGFVELSFTVNALGNVQDPIVIYAEPEGYFERAALQSIERWKYAAAMERGEPVATHDVRQRIVFQIEATSNR